MTYVFLPFLHISENYISPSISHLATLLVFVIKDNICDLSKFCFLWKIQINCITIHTSNGLYQYLYTKNSFSESAYIFWNSEFLRPCALASFILKCNYNLRPGKTKIFLQEFRCRSLYCGIRHFNFIKGCACRNTPRRS